MRVLLTTLNSKYVHSSPALKYLYLSGERYCDELEVKEFTINNSRDYIFTELVRGNFEAVCFSCYIWNVEQSLELASSLKKANPGCVILFGGPEVSYDGIGFLEKYPFVDFLIAGEGEEAFSKWCKAFRGTISYCQVPGLIYRASNEIVENPPAKPVDLTSLPFLYESFPCEQDKVIYYESARGCPFRCSYCISSIERNLRALPVNRIKEEMHFFLRQKVRQVKFLDRTFNWDTARSREIFGLLMEEDNGLTNFHFEICADLLDEDTFALLKEARRGLFQFEIGIQSVNEKALAAVNRTGSLNQVLENTRRLVNMGNIHTHVDLIAGLPFEDYRSFANSFNAVYALGAEHFQLGFLKLLKGTEIRKKAEEFAYTYMDRAPYQVISNCFISAREICALKQIDTVLDLYRNRGGFDRGLAFSIEREENAFSFYEDFADFYYTKGFQHSSHKKEDLYRIFYQFGCERGFGDELKKLLEADLEDTMNFDAVKKFKRKGWKFL